MPRQRDRRKPKNGKEFSTGSGRWPALTTTTWERSVAPTWLFTWCTSGTRSNSFAWSRLSTLDSFGFTLQEFQSRWMTSASKKMPIACKLLLSWMWQPLSLKYGSASLTACSRLLHLWSICCTSTRASLRWRQEEPSCLKTSSLVLSQARKKIKMIWLSYPRYPSTLPTLMTRT